MPMKKIIFAVEKIIYSITSELYRPVFPSLYTRLGTITPGILIIFLGHDIPQQVPGLELKLATGFFTVSHSPRTASASVFELKYL